MILLVVYVVICVKVVILFLSSFFLSVGLMFDSFFRLFVLFVVGVVVFLGVVFFFVLGVGVVVVIVVIDVVLIVVFMFDLFVFDLRMLVM